MDVASTSPANCLLLIDLQVGFSDSEYWGDSVNPHVHENVRTLIGHFQARDLPIVVVKHNSTSASSPLRPGSAGNELEPYLEGVGEVVVQKSVNSAFYGDPNLDELLRLRGISRVTIAGITTNQCCETTARMAGNLGYKVDFVLDATSTFRKSGPGGLEMSGEALMSATAVNLEAEFASVHLTTEQFLLGKNS